MPYADERRLERNLLPDYLGDPIGRHRHAPRGASRVAHGIHRVPASKVARIAESIERQRTEGKATKSQVFYTQHRQVQVLIGRLQKACR